MNSCPICGVSFRSWARHVCYSRSLAGIDGAHTRATREDDPDYVGVPVLEALTRTVSDRLSEGFAMLAD